MLERPAERTAPGIRGIAIASALYWLADLGALRAGAPDRLDDVWEHGAVARALLEGRGFRTPVIHPPLWTLRDAADHVPVLVHGPVVPLLLAPLVAVLGPGALDHVAWLAALFATLAAVATARLGARLLSPAVGAAAAGLLTWSPLMLRAVHHDLTMPLGAWLLALALDGLLRARPHAARAGAAVAIAALVRPELALAAPFLAPFAGRAWPRFALAAIALLAPWMAHVWLATGSPFFSLSSYLLIGYVGGRPDLTVLRDFRLTPQVWPGALAATLPELWQKWAATWRLALTGMFLSPSGGTGWLVPVGVLGAVQASASRRFVAAGLLLALIPFAVMTATYADGRFTVAVLPVMALLAARGAAEACEWLPAWARRPRTWMGLLALLVLPSIGPALHDARREALAAWAQLGAERAALATDAARPSGAGGATGTITYSDTPDFVAWTTRRPTVWLTREEYLALPVADTDSAGVTPARADRPIRSASDRVWFHAFDGRGPVLPRAPVAAPVPGGALR
jgi:hypothetical protein